jgi:hypothetical protein
VTGESFGIYSTVMGGVGPVTINWRQIYNRVSFINYTATSSWELRL